MAKVYAFWYGRKLLSIMARPCRTLIYAFDAKDVLECQILFSLLSEIIGLLGLGVP